MKQKQNPSSSEYGPQGLTRKRNGLVQGNTTRDLSAEQQQYTGGTLLDQMQHLRRLFALH